MRTFDLILRLVLFGLGLGLTTAHALDGRKSPDSNPDIPGVGAVVKPQTSAPDSPVGVVPPPSDATTILPAAGLNAAVKALEAAAEKGDAVAAWKLGRMYTDGLGGLERNPVRAVHFFVIVIQGRGNDQVPELRPYVADASVQLGLYYLKSDPAYAHKIFSYAASWLNDADAQYYLGRMYLDGQGVARETRLAEKWLKYAATGGQYEAQVKYGKLLIEGKVFTRDVATGLMWLKIALDTAPEGGAKEGVRSVYNSANEQATWVERADAEALYEKWKAKLLRTGK